MTTPAGDADQPLRAAARHATTAVPVLAPGDAAGEVRSSLAGQRFVSVRDLAVCDSGRLVGLLRVEDLLAAPPATTVGDLMDPDPPTSAPDADQEVAAWRAVRHGESSLALVDRDGRFAGIVPPHRLIAVLLAAHDQDVARTAGLLGTADPARAAVTEPLRRRLAHRLPWLLLGLAGALLSAALMGGFEERMAANVAIAFFIPGIVYMADAVGTQTEALVVRGLSVGVAVRRIARRELLTGLVLGIILALAFAPIGLVFWRDPALVAAVAVALFAACATATAVALLLPALLARAGSDPAFGSGPLATVVQDLLTLAIYFGFVALLLP